MNSPALASTISPRPLQAVDNFPRSPLLRKPVDVSMTSPEAVATTGLSKRSYTAPNELVPARMVPITQHAPRGTYVGIGTERCLLAAALNSQLERIVMIDNDPRVVLYNQVNIALLQGAGHRADHLHLRLQGTDEAICAATHQGAHAGAAGNYPPVEPATAQWWIQQVRNNASGNMAAFNDPPQPYDYAEANYLYDDQQFARVAQLAREGRLHAMLCDLADINQVAALIQDLQQAGEPLALLDLSNVWETIYLGHDLWPRLNDAFAPIAIDETLTLGTSCAWIDSDPSMVSIDYPWPGKSWRFTYFATRHGSVQTTQQRAALAQLLNCFDKSTRPSQPLEIEMEQVDGHLADVGERGDSRT